MRPQPDEHILWTAVKFFLWGITILFVLVSAWTWMSPGLSLSASGTAVAVLLLLREIRKGEERGSYGA